MAKNRGIIQPNQFVGSTGNTNSFPFKLTNVQDQQILVYDALVKKFVNQTLGSVTIIYGNLDGGDPAANYGGTISIDGGFYNSI